MTQHIKNKPIIIFEVQPENSICDFVNQTAFELSKKNPVYIYFPNSYDNKKNISIKKNITYVYPISILPLRRFSFIQNTNKKISIFLLSVYCFVKHHKLPIYWFFYPHLTYLIKPILFKYVIFDIVDTFTSPDLKINKKLFKSKRYLLKKAKVVTAICHPQLQHYQKIYNRKIHIVPQGFKILNTKINHKDISRLKGEKYIGYIGNINNRFDFKLLFKLIKNTKDYTYLFVGPISHEYNVRHKSNNNIKKLLKYKNVIHIDTVSKKQLLQFINIFNVCIIPYDTSEDFNKNSYPMKVFEYLYANKPILSTKIKSLKNLSQYVFLSNSYKKWISAITNTNQWYNPKNISSRKIALDNSWRRKIKKIKECL